MSDLNLHDLLYWLNQFNLSNSISDVEDLSDGVHFANILNEISSNEFTDVLKSTIQFDGNNSPIKKSLNLNLIVDTISRFFVTVINEPLTVEQLPDVTLIAEKNDAIELVRLIQLIVFCAVNCVNKEIYIQKILTMPQSVQHTIMEVIQNVMSERRASKQFDAISIGKFSDTDNLMKKCNELEARVVQLESEKVDLEAESRELTARLKLFDRGVNADSGSADETGLCTEAGSVATQLRIRQLQDSLTIAREELYSSDTERQETKLRLQESELERHKLKTLCDTLSAQAKEASHLKDELDIAREELQSAQILANSVNQINKRVDGNAYRIQCSKLEADNAACMVRINELEQENRLNSSLRITAEGNLQRLSEAHSRTSELLSLADKSAADLQTTQAELSLAIREKQTITNEFNRLRKQFEQLSLSKNNLDNDPLDCQVNSTIEIENEQDPKSVKNLSKAVPSDSKIQVTPRQSLSTVSNASSNPDLHVVGAPTLSESKPESTTVYEVEQRYRGYLAKALELIRHLDQRIVSGTEPQGTVDDQVASLRRLLVEKENIIEKLEHHHDEARRHRDLEERLFLTAWYHMGMNMQREEKYDSTEESEFNSSNSFLSIQRQIHLDSTPPRSRTSFR